MLQISLHDRMITGLVLKYVKNLAESRDGYRERKIILRGRYKATIAGSRGKYNIFHHENAISGPFDPWVSRLLHKCYP